MGQRECGLLVLGLPCPSFHWCFAASLQSIQRIQSVLSLRLRPTANLAIQPTRCAHTHRLTDHNELAFLLSALRRHPGRSEKALFRPRIIHRMAACVLGGWCADSHGILPGLHIGPTQFHHGVPYCRSVLGAACGLDSLPRQGSASSLSRRFAEAKRVKLRRDARTEYASWCGPHLGECLYTRRSSRKQSSAASFYFKTRLSGRR